MNNCCETEKVVSDCCDEACEQCCCSNCNELCVKCCCSNCNCKAIIGEVAPDFTCAAVLADGSIVNDFNFRTFTKNKYAILFFYPLDFTFVCPSEIIAFHNRINDFKSRNVEVVGVSIDSHFTHSAWRNTPVQQGGIGKIGYPLVADIKHSVCKAYGVESKEGVAYRGSFLIDKSGVVRHLVINDLSLGRNIDETLRMVDALQYSELHGEVCPAGWEKGKEAMKANSNSVAEYLSKNSTSL